MRDAHSLIHLYFLSKHFKDELGCRAYTTSLLNAPPNHSKRLQQHL